MVNGSVDLRCYWEPRLAACRAFLDVARPAARLLLAGGTSSAVTSRRHGNRRRRRLLLLLLTAPHAVPFKTPPPRYVT